VYFQDSMRNHCLFLFSAVILSGCSSSGPAESPAHNWRDNIFYMIVTDRFNDGDPRNNNIRAVYAPAKKNGIHGGDLKGIEQKLPYLKELGVNAIWLTPVQKNVRGAYHGYWIQDFLAVDPQLGTMDDLKQLIRAAHTMDIRVFLDVVCNHLGPMSHPANREHAWNDDGYSLVWADSSSIPSPEFFRNLDLYHNYGEVKEWRGQYQILGELPGGLDDLKTERQDVRDMLVRIWKWWMEQSGCDGFRIDTVKHVEADFWYEFIKAIKEHAIKLGKPDFFIFGEVYDYDDRKCATYTFPDSTGAQGFDAVLNFSMSGSIRNVFAQNRSISYLVKSIGNLSVYSPSSRPYLLSFVDNHDIGRFMYDARHDTSRLELALTFLFALEGVPVIYYGTEQAFYGGIGHEMNREDLFAGQWKGKNRDGDSFDTESRLYRFLQRLIAMRKGSEILRLGSMTIEHVDEKNQLLVLRRTQENRHAYAICNMGESAENYRTGCPHPLREWQSDTVEFSSEGSQGVMLSIPPQSVTIYLPVDR